MKSIRRLLLAIFALMLSICINVFFDGYVIPKVLFVITGLLPLGAILIVIYDLLEERFGK